jgi:hypothetical protein
MRYLVVVYTAMQLEIKLCSELKVGDGRHILQTCDMNVPYRII